MLATERNVPDGLGGAVYDPYAAQHTPSAPLKVHRDWLAPLRLMTEIAQFPVSAETTAAGAPMSTSTTRRTMVAGAARPPTLQELE